MAVDELCCLCQQENKSKDHLFFGYAYAKTIWKRIMQLCELRREVGSWEEELKWAILKLKMKALVSIILRLAWKAAIYHLWRERNQRKYEQIKENPEQVMNHVKVAVRLRTMGLKNIASDDVNRRLCCNWGISLV